MSYDTTQAQSKANRKEAFLVNFVVFGWFTGLTLVVYFMYYTFITIDAAFHIFLAIGAAATIAHYFYSRPREKSKLNTLIVLNFFGLGALFCGLFLTVNYFLRGPAYQEAYQIVEVNKKPEYGMRMHSSEIQLNKPYLEGFDYIVNYRQWKYTEFKDAKAIQIRFADGFFGYRICLGQRLLYE